MDGFPFRDGQFYCEDVPLRDIAAQFGTPAWVYSKNYLVSRFREIQTAFAAADPVICYSVKANSNLTLLRTMHEAGSSFDIVSGGELYRVKEAGADLRRVIFAGVGKTDDEIRFALESNILMFNVESEPELDAISRVAAQMSRQAPVALRLNPDVDAKTHAKTTTGKRGNKFGMDIERANVLAAKVLSDRNLTLTGIHMHLGSPILSTEPYAQAVEKAVRVVADFRRDGHEIRWMNLGGGFGISYRKEEGPPAAEYAKVIVPAVREARCQLALEPGRFIVGNAGVLLSRVIYAKQEGGKTFVIQDGAMNDLVRPAMYDAFHRIWPAVPLVAPPSDYEVNTPGCPPVDVVGPICESSDYLAKDRGLPPVERDDVLVTFSAGAYGMAMSSNYNSRPRAAEVLVDGKSVELIRRRESLADLVSHELSPGL
jgi:diaminopimelate decarboxylase